jgi:myo-inositol-1(or 4)-monophosphatase
MKPSSVLSALKSSEAAARAAGQRMRAHLRRAKKVNESTPHDIKLELDVRCQKLITRMLATDFPEIPVLGEEGRDEAAEAAAARWVVDPIDGTVNFAYGIPHACVSIALQVRGNNGFETVAGVVHDPFMDETWTATATGPARMNGRKIRVSSRKTLGEAIVSMGFAKSTGSLNLMLPVFGKLVHEVRKIRLMGSAALALTYVADGRFDGYIEAGIRLWDIAAGGLILQRAGGRFEINALPGEDYKYSLNSNNGLIHEGLARIAADAIRPAPSSRKKKS